MKKVFILGVTGQDGSYLAEICLQKGYDVFGLYRKSATGNLKNIEHIIDSDNKRKNFTLVQGDINDHGSIFRSIYDIKPDLIFNEADQDHVAWSYVIPSYSLNTSTVAVANILEAIKQIVPNCNYFQPVSSNMFGKVETHKQNENTPHQPVSPYGIAKSATFHLCRYYRESFGLNISTGIFYNHESERRSPEYLSRKVTMAAARIKKGLQHKLQLGDLSAKVDWGYAKEYMRIAELINSSNLNSDYIIGTGKLVSVEEFVDKTFLQLDLNYKNYIEISDDLKRPSKTGQLCADTSKLYNDFSIAPTIPIEKIITKMVKHDLSILK